MKTDFQNGERLFAEDLNDNFVETDNRLTATETNITALQSSAAFVPSGAVFWFASDSAPSGYLECDGSLVSRSTYSALFGVVGETFGSGDGSTTFKLPDLRGEFVRGWDDGRGVDSGRSFGSAQSASTNNVSEFGVVGGNGAGSATIPDDGTYSSAVGMTDGYDLRPWGSGAASIRFKTSNDETRPRNVALLACIKT